MKHEKKEWIENFIMVFVFVAFCYATRKIFFATYDDITYYMYARLREIGEKGSWWAEQTGRFYFNYSMYLYCLPYLADNYVIYKLISYLAVAFSVFGLWRLLRRRVDSSWAMIAVLLFLGMAQVDYQHNVFISYILHHQMTMGFIMLSYDFLLEYYKTQNRKQLIFSALCYAVPLFLYEAFLFYSIAYGLMAVSGVWYQNRNDRCMQKVLKVINDLKYHIICSIVFIICYFGFQLLSGGYYDGSEIVFSGWQKAVHTIFAFGTGLFPLKSYWENCRNISFFDLVSNIHVGGYIVALLVATGVVWLLPKVREIKFTEWAIISGISLISVFLPCIPYGFTEKYVDWISNGTYGYVPSYYGYFFIIIIIVLLVIVVYQCCRWKKVFKVVTWCVLFCVCILTAVNNSKTQNAYAFGTQRYISFENIVSSVTVLN